ncbi:MAG: hypothetical protein COW73_05790 [Nitrospirae bacterium CG18_big_fil_WC_8_21_14_2_50_70_55]|nr:DHA2 family efflux MFS transporter permease subunit [Deltaproteobacteria bacterium]OIP66255.1 MAG: hypothetical protein AUK30_02775 [Nitrospirae bacterium CG2_30_70_394]PIQ05535.1 MAG: hypothetical protein COW73_05790 [Nitrospirae bacterium CG18_big_fil_WC_8_21_14_2_50_70_55]PIU78262.1 MAG: hypothetical protein COS73_07710 [Nitrospirae bacterium CG06_land_8_20_14_3_00_70_43]PIW82790.1 MAG: hypothetical protein COZ96_06940 [Nitrospirae bacterium CG_4_8_14_3_um_filter_70_85]PIX84274.1 MAG: hy
MAGKAAPNRWLVSALVSTGIFIALLDTTIVDIVLPKMMSSLDADLYGVQWVVITYFLGSAIAMTAVGWTADVVGHRNTYFAGLALFIAMSALAGMAPTLEVMVATRFFQGVAEGILIPVSMVILFDIFPAEEHGIAMGIFGLSASFAPALGPALGGIITEALSWRWVFYVNVPVGLLDLALVFFLLTNKRAAYPPPPFDWVGFTLLAVAVASLIVITGKGQELGWLSSDLIFYLLLVLGVSGGAAAAWLGWAKNPLFPRHILKSRPFRLGLLAMALLSINAYGFFLLLPVFLQRIHGYTTLQSGLILLPGALLSAVVTVVAGAASDRMNPKWIAASCLLVMAAASWFFHADMDTPHAVLVLDYLYWGAFVGATFAPVTIIALGTLEERDIADGSTLLNIIRLITGSVGSAYATTLLTSRTDRFYTGLADRLDLGASGAALLDRFHSLAGPAGPYFDPDTWARFAATAHGLMLRRASSYAFHATYQHLAFFAVAAAVVVVLVKRLPHRGGGHGAMH